MVRANRWDRTSIVTSSWYESELAGYGGKEKNGGGNLTFLLRFSGTFMRATRIMPMGFVSVILVAAVQKDLGPPVWNEDPIVPSLCMSSIPHPRDV